MKYPESNLSYQQLVYNQIKTIQSITSKELRDGSKIIKNLMGEQAIEEEDTRFSYLQSVELLGSMLSPYFNSSITEEFDDYCTLLDMELIEAIKDTDFINEIKSMFNIKEKVVEKINEDDETKNQVNVYFLNEKIKVARRMFRSLVKLFKDNDYLSAETYGDSGAGEGEDESFDATDDGEDGEDLS